MGQTNILFSVPHFRPPIATCRFTEPQTSSSEPIHTPSPFFSIESHARLSFVLNEFPRHTFIVLSLSCACFSLYCYRCLAKGNTFSVRIPFSRTAHLKIYPIFIFIFLRKIYPNFTRVFVGLLGNATEGRILRRSAVFVPKFVFGSNTNVNKTTLR